MQQRPYGAAIICAIGDSVIIVEHHMHGGTSTPEAHSPQKTSKTVRRSFELLQSRQCSLRPQAYISGSVNLLPHPSHILTVWFW